MFPWNARNEGNENRSSRIGVCSILRQVLLHHSTCHVCYSCVWFDLLSLSLQPQTLCFYQAVRRGQRLTQFHDHAYSNIGV